MNDTGNTAPLEFGNIFGSTFSLAGQNYLKLILTVVMVYGIPFVTLLAFAVPLLLLSGGDVERFIERNPLKFVALGAFWIALIGTLPMWINACITAGKGKTVVIKELFVGPGTALKLIGTLFLVMIAVGLSCLLLVIPGFFVAIKLQLSTFFVVDKGMSPIEAMSASWHATSGNWWTIFGIDMAFGIIMWLSSFTIIGGPLFMPFFGVAMGNLYASLTGRE